MKRSVNFKEISVHSSAEESPGFLLWRASTFWRRAIEAVLKPFDLTHPQFVILATTAWLTREGARVSQAETGKHAALDPNTTSQILRGLEAKGLIERFYLKGEKTKYPVLTSEGSKRLKEALPAVEEADRLFFLSVDVNKSKMMKALQALARIEPES